MSHIEGSGEWLVESGGAGGSGRDAGDLDAGQFLPMTDRAVVALAAAILEIDQLRSLELLDHFGHDSRAFQGCAMLDLLARAMKEHFGKGDLGARLAVELFDFDDVTGCD